MRVIARSIDCRTGEVRDIEIEFEPLPPTAPGVDINKLAAALAAKGIITLDEVSELMTTK